ncbi:MAG: FMN-dependent oxidoreductase (nitrilotriacetate monooxygenase family) [Gammaproteobacteria bacterium]
MKKQIHLNAFTQCSICHHSKGQWKNPRDGSSLGYKDVNYWVDLAQTLERGNFDALFLADVHGTYNVFNGSRDAAVRHTVQFPSNDPTLVISAMAYATKRLGFACTYSTSYFAPYQAAKLFSTLDHLTNGRIAWNVVTSYLPDANANFEIGDQMSHDERYERAEEYLDVVYKLWEHSWEEDAAVRDIENDVHNDPTKVHEINHKGTWFNVPGPHMCEPSLQRTPVLFQAGQSGRGVEFAARHAEAVFALCADLNHSRDNAKKVRAAVEKQGRAPEHVKIFPGITPIVAASDTEADEKFEQMKEYASPEGALALFSGWVGIDLSTITSDMLLSDTKTEAIQGLLSYFEIVDPNREWTVEAMGEQISIGSVMPKFIGSPSTIADQMEHWMEESDIDGFNIAPAVQSSGFEEFVDLVVPELRRRGRVPETYQSATLREHYFGAGQSRLPSDHVAHRTLPSWKLA